MKTEIDKPLLPPISKNLKIGGSSNSSRAVLKNSTRTHGKRSYLASTAIKAKTNIGKF